MKYMAKNGGMLLIHDDLRNMVKEIKFFRTTMGNIEQNLFWSLTYNTQEREQGMQFPEIPSSPRTPAMSADLSYHIWTVKE